MPRKKSFERTFVKGQTIRDSFVGLYVDIILKLKIVTLIYYIKFKFNSRKSRFKKVKVIFLNLIPRVNFINVLQAAFAQVDVNFIYMHIFCRYFGAENYKAEMIGFVNLFQLCTFWALK